jgi:serine/threonine protein kinase/outer membrane protein assembly factor BamB
MSVGETPTLTPPQPGDPKVLGGYTVVGRLGEGGQGTVFLARGPAGERVAVKVLHARFGADPRARARFVREVDAARRVGGFCTARVLAADLDGDVPYVISEFIEGPSLREFILRRGPQSGAALERLAIGTLTALVTIHRAGIVHRDFKPGNVLLSPGGPRVVDFGIARLLDATSTLTSQAVGTPAYMAPEQLEGQSVTPATDMFAWGATMAYAATGNSPFGADSVAAVVAAILDAEPDLTGLTGPLRPMVDACLAKDPAARPDAARLLARLLEARPASITQSDNTLVAATHVLTELSSGPPTVPDRPRPVPGSVPGPRPSRRGLLIGAGSVTLAAALGGAFLLRGGKDERTRWRHDLNGDEVKSIVATGDTVFFVLGSGSLHALDAATGNQRWARNGDMTALALAGGWLLAADADHVENIDPATGRTRWSATVSTAGKLRIGAETISANPDFGDEAITVSGDVVITAIPDQAGSTSASLDRVGVTALRARDGRRQWSRTIDRPKEKLSTGVLGSLSASAQAVAVVVGVTVYGLSTGTGNVRWEYRLGGNVPGTGVAVGDTVLVGGGNVGQVFHALDAATGRQRWQAPLMEFNQDSLAADAQTVYVADSNRPGVHALDIRTGHERWQRTDISGGDTWGPVGGLVYVTSQADRTTSVLDAATGKTVWQKDGRVAPTFAATDSTAFLVLGDDKGDNQTINALRTTR